MPKDAVEIISGNEHHPGERFNERNALGEAQLAAWSAPERSNLHMEVPVRGQNYGWLAKNWID